MQDAIDAVVDRGYDDSPETIAVMAGLAQAAFELGAYSPMRGGEAAWEPTEWEPLLTGNETLEGQLESK